MSERMTVVVPLADGFEEVEAVSIIDVLRRAGIPVIVASVSGAESVRGAHGLDVGTDKPLTDVPATDVAMVALPGGMPGSVNLAESAVVLNLVRQVWKDGGLVAAICAAPLALHAAGILRGRRVTAYPSVRDKLTDAIYTDTNVERDGRLVTGKGPGVALAFSLALVAALGKDEAADQLREAMLVG